MSAYNALPGEILLPKGGRKRVKRMPEVFSTENTLLQIHHKIAPNNETARALEQLNV
jgi:hypothetical protein